jgi:hypothetical protein
MPGQAGCGIQALPCQRHNFCHASDNQCLSSWAEVSCDMRRDAKRQLPGQQGQRVSLRTRNRRGGRDGSELRMRPERTGARDRWTQQEEKGEGTTSLGL